MSGSPSSPAPSPFARIWADIIAAGWRDAILRLASHGLLLALMGGVLALRGLQLPTLEGLRAQALNIAPTAAPTMAEANLAASPAAAPGAAAPPTFGQLANEEVALARGVEAHTLIATRGREAVITYTVAPGDTLVGIAARFNLKPETVLWSNYAALKDDAHRLRAGQALIILPLDGIYHYVTEGSTLEQIARFYQVAPEAIAAWPGNALATAAAPVRPNSYLLIPGGVRQSQAWALPSLPRTSKASGRAVSNFGQCPGGYTGILGTGVFVWPTLARTVSGSDYALIHQGMDLSADAGDPVAAVDNGVVMYAGWNEFGYGNLVVIDHGNGWESVYGNLSQWSVQCGQSVSQGELVGTAGSSGTAPGPQLHFELRFDGVPVNPRTVLP